MRNFMRCKKGLISIVTQSFQHCVTIFRFQDIPLNTRIILYYIPALCHHDHTFFPTKRDPIFYDRLYAPVL